jgi:hypothetical protein
MTCLGRQALRERIAILFPLPWGEGARRAGEGARVSPMTTHQEALDQAPAVFDPNPPGKPLCRHPGLTPIPLN